MTQTCTIVMFHYVRDLPRTRFPRIRGLPTGQFKSQLTFLGSRYSIASPQDCLSAIYSGMRLPPNPALLTFDDGYSDHFETVFPVLVKRGFKAAFFPCARPVLENRVLDVNKIHFVLAAVEDSERLLRELNALVEEHRPQYQLLSPAEYLAQFAHANRFDSKEVIYIKRMLQTGLPPALRSMIASRLFSKYVTTDESGFSSELYMSEDQLKVMVQAGMTLGSHSYDHLWMDTLTQQQQNEEIARSVRFLERIGVPRDGWTMAYPYGAHNSSLREVIQKNGCKLAFTARPRVAGLSEANALTLERLDTNDLPIGT